MIQIRARAMRRWWAQSGQHMGAGVPEMNQRIRENIMQWSFYAGWNAAKRQYSPRRLKNGT